MLWKEVPITVPAVESMIVRAGAVGLIAAAWYQRAWDRLFHTR